MAILVFSGDRLIWQITFFKSSYVGSSHIKQQLEVQPNFEKSLYII